MFGVLRYVSSTCTHCQRNQQLTVLFHLQPGVGASDQNSSDLLDHSIQMGLEYIEDLTWTWSREDLSSRFATKQVSKQSPQLQRLARKSKFHQ